MLAVGHSTAEASQHRGCGSDGSPDEAVYKLTTLTGSVGMLGWSGEFGALRANWAPTHQPDHPASILLLPGGEK